MTGDVFEKHPFGCDFPDDPGNVGPQVAFVVLSPPLSGVGEWLAGIACEHGVEGSAEWPRVECGDVIPDWRGREISGPLGGDEGVSGVFFDFNPNTGSEAGFDQVESHVESAASATQAEAVRWSGR